MRREPTLPQKLSCVAKVESLVKKYGSRDAVPSWEARDLEMSTGWLWRTQLKKWYGEKESLAKVCAKLKIGSHGLRPFGSCKSLSKKQSRSMGCRVRSETDKESFQSDVLAVLKSFLSTEGQWG